MADGIAFGAIGTVDNAVAETTVDATYRKVTAFDTNGQSNRVTPGHTSDDLTIVEGGTYHISGHVSFFGTLSKTFRITATKNGNAIGIPAERKLGTGGDIGAAAFCGLEVCSAGDTIEVYQKSTDGGIALTCQHLSLIITRVL